MTEHLLNDLNSAQRQAVQAHDGPVLVFAGPGSGKTRVLTHRVAYLIHERGVRPEQIMAVTFTNRAAREMYERLEQLIGDESSRRLTVGTFHRICARILRQNHDRMGRNGIFTIYDTDDQQRLMKQAISDLGIDIQRLTPREILSDISSAKQENVYPEEYTRLQSISRQGEIIARCYTRYQELLLHNNAVDFDDLLLETVRLFQNHADVLATYQRRYRAILVDEYQDTNHLQYLIVNALAAHYRHLFVVGDHDQSIYSWRGADVRNILSFEQDYPDAQVVLLEQNYRSTQMVLDVAQQVMNQSANDAPVNYRKQLWSLKQSGEPVRMWEAYDPIDEAWMVVDEIRNLVASGAYRLCDCAIMYRTNMQSRPLEDAFIRGGIRYRIVGGLNLYDRKEVRDLLAYLRVAQNPHDSISLERIINVPPRGIGKRTIELLHSVMSEHRLSLMEAIGLVAGVQQSHTIDNLPRVTPKVRRALSEMCDMIAWLGEQQRTIPLPALLMALLERMELHEALQHIREPNTDEQRWEALADIVRIASEYAMLPQAEQLPAFLERIALMTDSDSLGAEKDQDGVTCVTLHQAKGLEYAVVFLIGLEEGLLPHIRSSQFPEQLEEERRLFYVGVTRAKERLYLVYAYRRMELGTTRQSSPSRFLRDIPLSMVQKQRRKALDTPRNTLASLLGLSLMPSRATVADSWSSTTSSQTVSFSPGQPVRHMNFGEGIVISSKPIEGDEEVVVMFRDVGQKRLLASFARLEAIENGS